MVELGPDAATSKGMSEFPIINPLDTCVWKMDVDVDGVTGDGEIPEHGIRVGDIVVVSEQPAGSAKKREVKELEGKGSRGVVTRVGKAAVWVALDSEEDEVGSKRLWVVKLANDVTYKRSVQFAS